MFSYKVKKIVSYMLLVYLLLNEKFLVDIL